MTRLDRVVATVVALTGAIAVLEVFSDMGRPVRPLVVLPFLAIGPGYAVVLLLGLRDRVAEATLAVALSIAIDMAVAMVMLYAGAWSPRFAVLAIASLSTVCVAAAFPLRRSVLP